MVDFFGVRGAAAGATPRERAGVPVPTLEAFSILGPFFTLGLFFARVLFLREGMGSNILAGAGIGSRPGVAVTIRNLRRH